VHGHPVSSLESVRLFLSGLKTAGLGRKILWGKDLAARYSVFKELFLTAFAGAIMHEFEVGRKVRCHTGGLWKTVGGPRPRPLFSGLGKWDRPVYPRFLAGFQIQFREWLNGPLWEDCSLSVFDSRPNELLDRFRFDGRQA
jgi:hypothetical protein